MRQFRLSGSVEGIMGNHDSYSDGKMGLRSQVSGFTSGSFFGSQMVSHQLAVILARSSSLGAA